MSRKYINPVLSGFYPDPSICRVENDFYLVNSTFAYFPGIPVFHSVDLFHWKQIGNAIDRPGQLCYDGHQVSQGLFAPTIRYNKGIFYILCTLIGKDGNFIITAENPAGPWSEPVWLKDAEGIDPSIFFDDDGKVWYCGTHSVPEGQAYPGNNEIYIQEINLSLLSAGKNPLTSKSTGIWRGALLNAVWPEGPHIYKINGWYYLLYAEGGTGLDHAVCVARAKDISGPWEGKKSNPVLTHRHLGRNADIINAGHADIFDDTNGNWWMVLLASRPHYGVCPLGRETFMVPIHWEDDWPCISSKSGLIEKEFPLPPLPITNKDPLWSYEPSCDHFNGALPLHWLMLRMPENKKDAAVSFNSRSGALRLFTRAATMRGTKEHPAFAGRRIKHKNWAFCAAVDFSPKTADESAGIILLQSEDYQYRFEICIGLSGKPSLRLILAAGKEDQILAEAECPVTEKYLVLAAVCEEMALSFFCGKDQYSLTCFSDHHDARILSTEFAGGFVGSLAGIFASGNGKDIEHCADVLWAEYKELL
ncbi:MAG: glycoside hydrolase family 43 protein [Treponema sp.]|jgi:alpha-N-arabinofuranosidase|nr:glycoside hydrolase family 43 protein [Treponema sp.]